MRTRSVAFVGLLCLLAAVPGFAQEVPSAAPRRSATIAVVRDGTCAYFSNLLEHVKTEFEVLAREDWDIAWKDGPEYDAGWDPARVGPILRQALADAEVDMILLGGILMSEHAARGTFELSKPVVSGFVQDPDTVGMPYNEDGFSTRRNFSFVIVPLRSTRDVAEFRELAGFEQLTIVVDRVLLDGLPDLRAQIARFALDAGIRVRVVPSGTSADEVLNQLGTEDAAVYLTPAMLMDGAEWQELIDGINSRKIPSFSLMGHEDVERGVLAGLAPDITSRLARRLALNMEQILSGTPPEALPVPMAVDEKLMINARTAAQIGFYPPFRVMQRAEILHRDQFPLGDALTLDTAMQIAVDNNLDLAVKTEEVAISREDRNKSLTALLPQVDANARYYRVDTDRAEASNGLQPRNATVGGVSLTQVLFSDPAMAAYRSLKRLHLSKDYEREAVRLDVAQNAARLFLQYLSARAVYRIELDNFALTRQNLDMARVRHNAGTSGPEEVYRWEAEMAKRRGSVATAEAATLQALAALNQVMGVPIEKPWDAKEIGAGDASYYFLNPDFSDLVSDEHKFDILLQYVLESASRDAPELKAVDLAIEAQRIQVAQFKRRSLVPEIGLSLSCDHEFDEDLAGPTLAEQFAAAGVPLQAGPEADENEWTASVQARWSLFAGGGHAVDLAKAEAELRRLEELRARTEQSIRQRVYTAMYATWGSSPNIHHTRAAADAAAKNLSVIREKYARGAVSILDLLDAQNQAFLQNQDADLAVYQFVSDVMDAQRAMARFAALSTKEDCACCVRPRAPLRPAVPSARPRRCRPSGRWSPCGSRTRGGPARERSPASPVRRWRRSSASASAARSWNCP